MQHLDEGMIHTWLDGELPPAEREAVEAHIASCEQCAAAAAEARGFVAASSRILLALDTVPGGVVPTTSAASSASPPAVRRRFVAPRAWMAAAAVLVLSTVTVIAIKPSRDTAELRVAAATQDEKKDQPASAPPLEQGPMASKRALEPRALKPQALDSHAIRAGAAAASGAPSQSANAAPATENELSRKAPATAPSRVAAPADEPKPVDQTERLKSRLEAERKSTRVLSNSAPPVMADAAPAPRAADASAATDQVSALAETPPASLAGKAAADKREDDLSKSDSTSARRAAASVRSVTITGHVTTETGEPLAGASIALEHTGVGALTRADGSYELRVPAERADGKAASLVARLIGYKSVSVPVATSGAPISHDFVLASNPLALGQIVVTGEGTSSASQSKSSRAASSVDNASLLLSDGEHAPVVSRESSMVRGEPVEVTTYLVRERYITFIDRFKPDTTQHSIEKELRSALERDQDTTEGTINSITWTDAVGRVRTLRGAVTTRELERFKKQLLAVIP